MKWKMTRHWGNVATPVTPDRGGHMQQMWKQWSRWYLSSIQETTSSSVLQIPQAATTTTAGAWKDAKGCEVKGDVSSSPLEVGYQAPVTKGLYDTERLTTKLNFKDSYKYLRIPKATMTRLLASRPEPNILDRKHLTITRYSSRIINWPKEANVQQRGCT